MENARTFVAAYHSICDVTCSRYFVAHIITYFVAQISRALVKQPLAVRSIRGCSPPLTQLSDDWLSWNGNEPSSPRRGVSSRRLTRQSAGLVSLSLSLSLFLSFFSCCWPRSWSPVSVPAQDMQSLRRGISFTRRLLSMQCVHYRHQEKTNGASKGLRVSNCSGVLYSAI